MTVFKIIITVIAVLIIFVILEQINKEQEGGEMPETYDKDVVLSYYQRKIYSVNNKIAQIVKTKKHYEAWMECSKTEPSKSFTEYLDALKSDYQVELEYWKRKRAEV